MKVVIFAVLLGLVGCGDEDKESVTKAIEAASQTNQGIIDNSNDGTCPEKDTDEPAQVCDR